MNLSAADLHIETNDNGFILGQSFLGDTITDEENVWREVRTDFSSLSLTRSVSVEKGVLFRPEAATLTLRTPTTVYMSGVFGRRVRILWKDEVLFVGEVKSASLASNAEHEGDKTYMNITAVGLVEHVNNYVLYNFSAPQQNAGERITTAVPLGLDVSVNNCLRPMAAREASNIKLISVLQDASDAQIARFYVDKQNALIVDGSPAADPVVVFSDDHSLPGHVCYRNVNMSENLANTITGVVVEAKQDESLTAINRHPSAVVTHEESYQIDLPVDQTEVTAWAQSFPLMGYTRLEPSSLDTYWQDGLAALELTQLVDIYWKGNYYRAGVKAINFDIRPDHEDGLEWDVKVDLMPGHLLEFTSIIAPSEPNAFEAVVLDDHNIELSWARPALPNNMNGYELRVAQGSIPPDRTDGVVVASLGNDVTTFTHAGLTSNTEYAYSLWATTTNALVGSKRVTAVAKTRETVPTAVRNLTVVKGGSPDLHTLTWTAPALPGDVASYDVRYRTDGIDPTPTTGTQAALVPYGTNTLTQSGLVRNRTYRWGVFPKTGLGAYGPGAFVTRDTNETLPSAPRNVDAYATAYNNVHLHWDAPATVGDMNRYVVRWDYNSAPSLSSGHAWTTVGSAVHDLDLATSGATTYGFTVWGLTVGNLTGPGGSDVATTPQGIFNKYWEGEAVWTQSYKSNNTPSSLGSGFADDLYYGYGDSFNGNQRSMAGWGLPGDIVNCYAVDRVELHIYNKHTWNNSGADCWFGVHGWTGVPGTFQQSAGGLAVYHMSKPGWLDVDATGWLAGQLRAGAKGITLGPAPSNANAYYGYAAGVRGPRPLIKVWYRTIGS